MVAAIEACDALALPASEQLEFGKTAWTPLAQVHHLWEYLNEIPRASSGTSVVFRASWV